MKVFNKEENVVRAKEVSDGILVKCRVDFNNHKLVKVNFKNYFFISKKDVIDFDELASLIGNDATITEADNPNYFKILLHDNTMRNLVNYKIKNNNIKTFEADINAVKRYSILNNFNINPKNYKWLIYDIETKDDGLFEKNIDGTIIATEPVLSCAYMDNTGKLSYIKNENLNNPILGEKDLLLKVEKLIFDYDIITAWNSYRFDDSYIKQRFLFHDMNLDSWDYINQLDYMEMVKSNKRFDKYSLDFVSSSLLGNKKIVVENKGNGAILNLWKKSFEGDTSLETYNKKDVELIYEIDKKLNLISLYQNISEVADIFIQESLRNSNIWDLSLLREYTFINKISPTKPRVDEIERRKKHNFLAGAYSFCLNKGLHSDVEVFDFKSFYPTTIAALNICNTTICEDGSVNEDNYIDKNYSKIESDIHRVLIKGSINPFLMNIKKNNSKELNVIQSTLSNNISFFVKEVKPNDIYMKFKTQFYDNNKIGILPKLMINYINERDKYKYKIKVEKDETIKNNYKILQNAYKTIANSGYGVFGLKSFRYFDERIANSITTFCRYTIKECIKVAEKYGFNVIQGDTDSIMIKNKSKTKSINELEEIFFDYFDGFANKLNINSNKFLLTNPVTNEKVEKNHFIVLEHEKSFIKMISVAIKNYAALISLPNNLTEVGIVGLDCIKKSTNKLAKELQYRLIKDILQEKIIVDEKNEGFIEFVNYLKDINNKLNNNTLDIKYLTMSGTISKALSLYGQPVIDKNTAKPKVKKDGTIQYAPIPAHIKLAREFVEQGKDVSIGDSISYIVKSSKPIVPLSITNYNNNEPIDINYYLAAIFRPIKRILNVINPEIFCIFDELILNGNVYK